MFIHGMPARHATTVIFDAQCPHWCCADHRMHLSISMSRQRQKSEVAHALAQRNGMTSTTMPITRQARSEDAFLRRGQERTR
jgi:hypothetical protein